MYILLGSLCTVMEHLANVTHLITVHYHHSVVCMGLWSLDRQNHSMKEEKPTQTGSVLAHLLIWSTECTHVLVVIIPQCPYTYCIIRVSVDAKAHNLRTHPHTNLCLNYSQSN